MLLDSEPVSSWTRTATHIVNLTVGKINLCCLRHPASYADHLLQSFNPHELSSGMALSGFEVQ